MKPIETLQSHVVYQNKWMTVREDKIRRASGAEGIYGMIDKPDFAAIIPVDKGFIQLVQQYRYPVGARYWEIPQGSLEDNPDADKFTIAKAELREETGLIANQMTHIGHIYQAYGISNQGFDLFYATDFEHTEQALDNEEEDLITARFPVAEFESMISSGVIKDATTISAYGLAKLKGIF